MASRALRRKSTYRALNSHKRYKSRPVLKIALVLFVVIMMLTSGASAATLLFYGQSLPSLTAFKSHLQFQNTVIRDRYGKPIYNLADLTRAGGERVVEPLSQPGHPTAYYQHTGQTWLAGDDRPGIPVALQNATISTEDATFYSNPGFDPLSILRAGYDNFAKGHVVSGASTITQQLIKQYLLSDASRNLSRKVQEVILAYQLTQKYPKSKILWYYLNSIPYGNVSVGAQAAAKNYFRTNVWQLDPAQCAFLAGLPEAPSTYNPVNNLPAALARMRHVLQLMYDHGYLVDAHGRKDASIITAYMSEASHWKRFEPPTSFNTYPHFVQFAVNQLQLLTDTVPVLSGKLYDGLDVYTTIDPAMEKAALDTVTNQIGQLASYNATDAALVSIEVRRGPTACYGCIRAWVGSADYHNTAISGQTNMADSPRQPGSSFKPFNYIYAFEHGLGPATVVDDAPISIPDVGNAADGNVYAPTNYDHLFHGAVTLRTALQNSLNIPAVKVEQYAAAVGGSVYDTVRAEAIKLGMTSLPSDNPNCCGWALTLGGMEHGVRLYEETAAYGAFATGGLRVTPTAIDRIVDRTTGQVLWSRSAQDWARSPQQVVTPAAAYVMNNVLSDDASRCTPAVCEFGVHSQLYLGRTVAAKTGTTESFTDNWTVGYTPDIVTGVWVGNANNNPMAANTTGITGAAPIWHDFMLKAFDIMKLAPKDFSQPPGVYFGSACQQPSAYGGTISSSFGYDLYAVTVPYCSIGGGYIPAPASQYNNTQVPQAAPTATPPPVVQQPAVQQPTASGQFVAPTAVPQPTQDTSGQTGTIQGATVPTTVPTTPLQP